MGFLLVMEILQLNQTTGKLYTLKGESYGTEIIFKALKKMK